MVNVKTVVITTTIILLFMEIPIINILMIILCIIIWNDFLKSL